MSKSRTLTRAALLTLGVALIPGLASAQYYAPPPSTLIPADKPTALVIDPGFNEGFYPAVGVGYDKFGVGVGSGFGARGIGSGVTAGLGPLGLAGDAGWSDNGLGARASAGIGSGTGANAELGFTNGGIGAGASAKILGFGTGASIGLGSKGPGLGASVALGPLGRIALGSHTNTYPGSAQTYNAIEPSVTQTYYQPRVYGSQPAYRGSLIMPISQQAQTLYAVPQSLQPQAYRQPVYAPQAPACQTGWDGRCR